MNKDNKNIEAANTISVRPKNNDASKKIFKKEVMELFQRYGYLSNGKDHEVTFRTTSGNIAWININSIETIK